MNHSAKRRRGAWGSFSLILTLFLLVVSLASAVETTQIDHTIEPPHELDPSHGHVWLDHDVSGAAEQAPTYSQLVVTFPSGATFAEITNPADGINYVDPVTGGSVPLIDLQGNLGTSLHTNFVADEFDCCNDSAYANARYARISPTLITELQLIRNALGAPLNVNSGYRHQAYNAYVGGASSSMHMTGLGADIASGSATPLQLADIALTQMGCDIGIGLYVSHLHIDVRGTLTSWTGSGAAMTEVEFDTWVAQRCSDPLAVDFMAMEAGQTQQTPNSTLVILMVVLISLVLVTKRNLGRVPH